VCLVLEAGVLGGVQMPPEKIRALLDSLNQPKLAHILPAESEDGDDPHDPEGDRLSTNAAVRGASHGRP
jgi:hypothetical protein